MHFIDQIKKFISDNDLLDKGDKVVVGVSGGADSVCLLHVLNSLKDSLELDILAVHINHMIRGAEADGDQKFVEDLCDSLGIKWKCFRIDVPSLAEKDNLTEEEAGRNARYETFYSVMKENGFNKIAVAHNSDDLTETVIFNMVRGSSIRGISGIPVKRGEIIRPLLQTSRKAIEEHLRTIGQEYVTDSTNLEDIYSRNIIRHEILPKLKELNKGADNHIVRLASEMEEIYDIIKCSAESVSLEKESGENDRINILISDIDGLSKLIRSEVYLRALEELAGKRKDVTATHLSAVDKLIKMENGKELDLPYGIKVYKSYDKIVFVRNTPGKRKNGLTIVSDDGKYYLGDGILEIKKVKYEKGMEIPSEDMYKAIDAGKINDILRFRLPEDGDFIRISASGSKKLKRLFTDMKIDKMRRKAIPILAVGNEVIWAVGLRLSEAFKIDDDTEDIIYLKYIEGIDE